VDTAGPQRPDRMPEDMPDRMPEDMSDRISEDMPDRMPEDLPDRMPEDMSDRMSEDMPDRMPEDMLDRMPEDLPVRKYINVMVGITRSKIISLINICFINYCSLYIIYYWENIVYSITDGRGFDIKFILIFCILLYLFV